MLINQAQISGADGWTAGGHYVQRAVLPDNNGRRMTGIAGGKTTGGRIQYDIIECSLLNYCCNRKSISDLLKASACSILDK